jgi:hypothetical protein
MYSKLKQRGQAQLFGFFYINPKITRWEQSRTKGADPFASHLPAFFPSFRFSVVPLFLPQPPRRAAPVLVLQGVCPESQ